MEENKKTLALVEKMIYSIFIMLTIVLICFLSYPKNKIVFYASTVILLIELIIFMVVQNAEKKNLIEKIVQDSKKTKRVRNIVFVITGIVILAFASLFAYMIIDIVRSKAYSFFYELMSLNVISFVIFVLLIAILLLNKRTESEEKIEKTPQNEKYNKTIELLVYGLFVIITCIIPFYAYFLKKPELVWSIGCLSSLIFGVLTSVTLRGTKYNKMSYIILAMAIMLTSFIGLFSSIPTFTLAYTLFLASSIISVVAFAIYNKNKITSDIILIALLLGLVVAQIVISVLL